jgi:hypothetical protein
MVRSGAQYPRDALSRGCNIQEFSVGDTSVGDEITLRGEVDRKWGLERGKGTGEWIEREGKKMAGQEGGEGQENGRGALEREEKRVIGSNKTSQRLSSAFNLHNIDR